jgi:hypothetical protein
MPKMYPAQVNSPQTTLASGIDDTQTTATVADGSKLPDAPNILVLGDGETAETILYTSKVGNNLSGITRAFQGAASSWNAGTGVARFFTAYDQSSMQDNINSQTAISILSM